MKTIETRKIIHAEQTGYCWLTDTNMSCIHCICKAWNQSLSTILSASPLRNPYDKAVNSPVQSITHRITTVLHPPSRVPTDMNDIWHRPSCPRDHSSLHSTSQRVTAGMIGEALAVALVISMTGLLVGQAQHILTSKNCLPPAQPTGCLTVFFTLSQWYCKTCLPLQAFGSDRCEQQEQPQWQQEAKPPQNRHHSLWFSNRCLQADLSAFPTWLLIADCC